MSKIITVSLSSVWQRLDVLTGIPTGVGVDVQNQSTSVVWVQVSPTMPTELTEGNYLKVGPNEVTSISIASGQDLVWVRGGGNIAVSTKGVLSIGGIDSGVYLGRAAICAQSYDEANKKAGLQWEASKLFQATAGQVFRTVLLTGSKTVDLKKREFAYTGEELTANIYLNPTYTGGTSEPVYNMRPSQGSPELQIIVGATVTDAGTQCGATIYALGNTAVQGKGSLLVPLASNRILDENTAYLLEIISADVQDITSRLESYEGRLDINP